MNLNELANGKAMVTIAGCEVEVNTSDPVKETVKRILQEKASTLSRFWSMVKR